MSAIQQQLEFCTSDLGTSETLVMQITVSKSKQQFLAVTTPCTAVHTHGVRSIKDASLAAPDNSPHRREVYPEMIGELLIGVSTCRVSRHCSGKEDRPRSHFFIKRLVVAQLRPLAWQRAMANQDDDG